MMCVLESRVTQKKDLIVLRRAEEKLLVQPNDHVVGRERDDSAEMRSSV